MFKYDADGNLTNDGRWSYTWDAENRLVTITGNGNLPTAARLKLDLTYDYRNRRITKRVSTWNGSSYVTAYTNKFLYDGWSLIAELNQSNGVVRTFLWGSDLSGSLQGAGGVGGLLAVTATTNGTHFPAFDGNGNVSALVSASAGTHTASYDFGPFGEVIRADGIGANSCPVRFSTKYQDPETDLLYFGERYYSAVTGRWLSRDPIAEEGGLNVYALGGNDPVDSVDPLGLQYHPSTGANNVIRAYIPVPVSESHFVQTARSHIGSKRWSTWSHLDRRFRFGANKCNKFVHDMAKEAGLIPPLVPIDPNDPWSPLRPATAEELQDPMLSIPGWTLPGFGARPGDIVSDGAHTGIESGIGRVSASTLVNRVVENEWGADERARSPTPYVPSALPIPYEGGKVNLPRINR